MSIADHRTTEDTATGELVPYLEPMRQVLTELVDAALDLAPSSGIPAADSKAMAELYEEAKLENGHWTQPVRAAHSAAGVLRFAAGDHIRSYVRLFGGLPVPVYSHLVTARCCLDACGVALWLGAADTSAMIRVKRYQVMRMMNADQLKRAPVPAWKEHGKANIDNVIAGAREHGWGVSRSNLSVAGIEPPKPRQLIQTVLDDIPSSFDDNIGLGDVLWWYLSGATHSTSYALMQSIDASGGQTNPIGEPMAAIFTSGRSVELFGLTVARAFEKVTAEHAALFGWTSERWTTARHSLNELRRTTIQRGPAPTRSARTP